MNHIQLRQRYIILLKKCIQFYHEKSENQALSYNSMRRALLYMEEFPQRCLEETGVQLYKYKNIILTGDLTKLYDNNRDLTECPETMKGEADTLIDNLIMSWKNVTQAENQDLVKILLEALNLYLNYVAREKQKRNTT